VARRAPRRSASVKRHRAGRGQARRFELRVKNLLAAGGDPRSGPKDFDLSPSSLIVFTPPSCSSGSALRRRPASERATRRGRRGDLSNRTRPPERRTMMGAWSGTTRRDSRSSTLAELYLEICRHHRPWRLEPSQFTYSTKLVIWRQ
jgi:hypothetical protein